MKEEEYQLYIEDVKEEDQIALYVGYSDGEGEYVPLFAKASTFKMSHLKDVMKKQGRVDIMIGFERAEE